MNQGFGGWSPQQHRTVIVDTLAADVTVGTSNVDVTSRTLPAGWWKATYNMIYIANGGGRLVTWTCWDKVSTPYGNKRDNATINAVMSICLPIIFFLPSPTTVYLTALADANTITVHANEIGVTGAASAPGTTIIYEPLYMAMTPR